jgi:hypothetical protein
MAQMLKNAAAAEAPAAEGAIRSVGVGGFTPPARPQVPPELAAAFEAADAVPAAGSFQAGTGKLAEMLGQQPNYVLRTPTQTAEIVNALKAAAVRRTGGQSLAASREWMKAEMAARGIPPEYIDDIMSYRVSRRPGL